MSFRRHADSLELDYALCGTGWAVATIRLGSDEVRMLASYLHDSLTELAQVTIGLCSGTREATVSFMDEPGEHLLVLHRQENEQLAFEVRWYKDWGSWGNCPPDQYWVELRGKTTVRRFRHQVVNVLWQLDQSLGPEQYKDQWMKSEFPSDEYARLKEML